MGNVKVKTVGAKTIRVGTIGAGGMVVPRKRGVIELFGLLDADGYALMSEDGFYLKVKG